MGRASVPVSDDPYRMHPLTLRFPAAAERAFYAAYCAASLRPARAILLLGGGIVTSVSLVQYVRFALGSNERVPSPLLPAVGLLCLAAVRLTYSRAFPRLMRPLFALLLVALGAANMLRLVRDQHLPDTGPLTAVVNIALLVVGLNFFRIGFAAAAPLALAMTAAWWAFAASRELVSFGVAVNVWLSLCGAAAAAYLSERHNRRDFASSRLLEAERARSERLLLNVLPAPIAARLKEHEGTIADRYEEATVLFADVVGFTDVSATLEPEALVGRLDRLFTAFDALTAARGLEKIKTIGDAYMVVGGLPVPRADHAEAVAGLALDLLRAVEAAGDGLRVRIGIHTGPVVAGVIGTTKFAYDLWGDTVNTASRMESHGVPGAIHCTEAAYGRLRDAFAFEKRGEIEVKGKGPMRTYLLTGRKLEAAHQFAPSAEVAPAAP